MRPVVCLPPGAPAEVSGLCRAVTESGVDAQSLAEFRDGVLHGLARGVHDDMVAVPWLVVWSAMFCRVGRVRSGLSMVCDVVLCSCSTGSEQMSSTLNEPAVAR